MTTRAGLANEDMEFVQFHPTGMSGRKYQCNIALEIFIIVVIGIFCGLAHTGLIEHWQGSAWQWR